MTDSSPLEGTKRCRVCGQLKLLNEFYRVAGARDGHRNDCKICNVERRKAAYRRNPRPAIEREQQWRRENPERYRERQREYRESGKKRMSDRKSYLKRTYGITLEQYDSMLAAQGGGCAICGNPGRDDISLHVDHDHATGAIRGLLCFRCNNALGDFADDGERFRAAVDYLDRDDELAGLARARARALVPAAG